MMDVVEKNGDRIDLRKLAQELGCQVFAISALKGTGIEEMTEAVLKAAEVMALAAVYTMEQPELIEKARQELLRKNGGKYTCPLPEYVQPPIGRY